MEGIDRKDVFFYQVLEYITMYVPVRMHVCAYVLASQGLGRGCMVDMYVRTYVCMYVCAV